MSFSRDLKIGIATLAIAVIVVLQSCSESKQPAANANKASEPAASSTTPSPAITPVDARVTEKESTFDHNRVEHKKLECSFCHQRTTESTPVFPGHSACNDCHQQDFSSTTTVLCAGCHKTPLEAVPQLLSFPTRLKQLGLRVFSHRDHMNPQKMPAGTERLSCGNCHRFAGRGVEASFPKHPECYSCHTHQAGEKLGECATCHTDRAVAMKYSSSGGSAYSLYNFKHSTHVNKASCDRCHRTTEPSSNTSSDILQISTARGQRHNSTCFTCHSRAKETVCSKCHRGSIPF